MDKHLHCPDCDSIPTPHRRDFLRSTAATLAAATTLPLGYASRAVAETPKPSSTPAETAVKALYDSLTEEQKKAICFPWDYQDKTRGLLRTHVSNNWQITDKRVLSPFFTKEQQTIIHDIFRGLINPEWYDRFMKQLKDDNGGKPWGTYQSIAIFGTPGSDKFEFVITGRHQTLRADGNTENHVAFGGPIFYGHAAETFNESGQHRGNVFWPQAIAANKVYQMLDGKQQKLALVPKSPRESAVAFTGARKEKRTGLPISEMTADQKAEMQKVLMLLVEPFRKTDQEEALECLRKQGGLDACHLSFYADADIDDDKVWDNWRLEGPSFVWYFRGDPHVHVWVNVADSPNVPTNARG